MTLCCLFFFFSSRRRHTRLQGDWSSDVCSSDLVGAVLEGSVRKAGNRVRVTAQVVKVADGFHVWSRTYDRDLTDIFAVQDEIARAVVEALKVKLLPGWSLVEQRAVNPAAHDQWLLALR